MPNAFCLISSSSSKTLLLLLLLFSLCSNLVVSSESFAQSTRRTSSSQTFLPACSAAGFLPYPGSFQPGIQDSPFAISQDAFFFLDTCVGCNSELRVQRAGADDIFGSADDTQEQKQLSVEAYQLFAVSPHLIAYAAFDSSTGSYLVTLGESGIDQIFGTSDDLFTDLLVASNPISLFVSTDQVLVAREVLGATPLDLYHYCNFSTNAGSGSCTVGNHFTSIEPSVSTNFDFTIETIGIRQGSHTAVVITQELSNSLLYLRTFWAADGGPFSVMSPYNGPTLSIQDASEPFVLFRNRRLGQEECFYAGVTPSWSPLLEGVKAESNERLVSCRLTGPGFGTIGVFRNLINPNEWKIRIKSDISSQVREFAPSNLGQAVWDRSFFGDSVSASVDTSGPRAGALNAVYFTRISSTGFGFQLFSCQ